ncbi:hypothetical protein ASG87_00630 [Frateuria sp. Soil773]|uniref:hypothetical protein n=1 Tax=Frateuria sp. Soil773 TaxID=1736407 RepID=UPI0006FCE862|nr:hypothetical protein [Frateuria sp. Soil773]KRE92457.1 hypothetical protein ASG87_00630 [Frateuria sp. Soil773]
MLNTHAAEAPRDDSELAKLRAETAKLIAETTKIEAQTRRVPYVAFAKVAAIAGIVAVLVKLLIE